MPISAARAAAFDILLRVERGDAYASELLHSSQHENLSRADHALMTELVMGVLRWRLLLDDQIATRSSQRLEKLDAEALIALQIGAYQLRFLSRVPARAAIHESVELIKRAGKRSAAGYVNAVLRKLAEAVEAHEISALANAVNAAALANLSSHPKWLVERWVHEFGLSVSRQICSYDQQVPQASISLNAPQVETELLDDGIILLQGDLLASARRVKSGDVTRTRAFRERRVTIQDEASQLVAMLVGRGTRILDCCAAPGGKTRVLARQNPDSMVLAVELHPHRARLLRRLVPEPNVQIIAADMRQFPVAGVFDRVLADVPCSGTGTLARNPEIKARLQAKDLAGFQERQLEILRSAMSRVAPGGRLVYSTCSLEPEENRGVVEQALTEESSFHVVDCRLELERLRAQGDLAAGDLDSLLNGPYLRTVPGVWQCDGFFAAVLEKSQTI